MPPVYFWQNMPAHHQTGALDELASSWGAPVTGVWCSDITISRRRQGWVAAPRHALLDVFLPSMNWESLVDGIIDGNPEAIHVFSGIGAYAPVTHALARLARRPSARIALIVESPVMLGWKKWFRFIKTKVNYAPYRRRIGAVFAMGSLGLDFYRKIGFSEAQLFPYLYQESVTPGPPRRVGRTVELVYAGQINHRKGVDILLKALNQVERQDWELTLYGDGDGKDDARELIASGPHAARVSFKGAVPSAQLMAELRDKDLLIVPSRFDGWGMAVNEGLQCGLSVITSSFAGASDLVRSSKAGTVFEAGCPRTLAQEIIRRLESRALLEEEKFLARNYAHRITPCVAGAYLSAALRHVFLHEGGPPAPGWLEPGDH